MEKRIEACKVYITLGERLDYELSVAAEEEIKAFCMQMPGADADAPFKAVRAIELDADALSYISSAGIRLLLKLKKRIKDMQVIHVADNIYETISITGMEELLGLQRRSGAAAAAGEGTQTAGAQKRAAQEGTAGSQTAADGTPKAAGAERPALDRSAWQDTAADIALTGINSTTAKGDFYAVTELFEQQVALHENDTAVVSAKGSYTYGELNKAANRIANTLLYMGIRPDDVVCILLERGIEIYAATLGVLKAGAAYTIANPKYPDERIEYIYRDAGCRYIISSKDMVYERLELFVDRLQKRPLFFEHLQSWPKDTDPKVTIRPEDLCYLIYTSG
ncbi:MAG: AMP-binding protein [Lachnospiraceae bacterium]|nr:AMP-binding protein [Lachnospiraceae bacterium]